eukprot:389438-Pelagomonas_calceolata.AAC.2
MQCLRLARLNRKHLVLAMKTHHKIQVASTAKMGMDTMTTSSSFDSGSSSKGKKVWDALTASDGAVFWTGGRLMALHAHLRT